MENNKSNNSKRTLIILQLFYLILFYCNGILAQIITTFAGGGASLSEGVPATIANIHNAQSGAFDAQGNYYFGEGLCCNIVRKVNTSGLIFTVAGNGTIGFSGDIGPATLAQLHELSGVAVDTLGNIFIADYGNARIRKVDVSTGIINTFAGNGMTSTLGDTGSATAVAILPIMVCTDRFGNLYIIDNNTRLRKINSHGIITTIAGNGTSGFTGDSGLATNAEIAATNGLCIDLSGNIYIGCSGRIRKVDIVTGIITTIAGNGNPIYAGAGMHADSAQFAPSSIARDLLGNIYIASITPDYVFQINTRNIFNIFAGTGVNGYNGDGGLADTTEIHSPNGLITDSCGNVYIADAGNFRIRKVTFDTSCHLHPTNLNEVRDNTKILIYPNPVNSLLTIQANNNISSILITNLLGQTVFYKTCMDEEKAEIDIRYLPFGVYFVAVVNDDAKKIIRKFIKE